MARVRFTEDFDYKPTSRITVGYLAGWSGTVKRDCADKAVAANKAMRLNASASKEDTVDDENTEPREA
ncbi:hypothetical protein [Shinella sp. BYT-45]|uniref:hypothetical protein n=1 Tax=Shinella sp. BYT-45 TaxID=3377377 RepID=UPI0039811131